MNAENTFKCTYYLFKLILQRANTINSVIMNRTNIRKLHIPSGAFFISHRKFHAV